MEIVFRKLIVNFIAWSICGHLTLICDSFIFGINCWLVDCFPFNLAYNRWSSI